MKNAGDDFDIIMKAFRRSRALKFDKKYCREHDAAINNEIFANYYGILESALSEENRHFLNDYTDCAIALYNTDADYFYDQGFNDCQQLYSKLFKIAPVFRVDDENDEDDDGIDSEALSDFKADAEDRDVLREHGKVFAHDINAENGDGTLN